MALSTLRKVLYLLVTTAEFVKPSSVWVEQFTVWYGYICTAIAFGVIDRVNMEDFDYEGEQYGIKDERANDHRLLSKDARAGTQKEK